MNIGNGIIAQAPAFLNDLVIAGSGTIFISRPFTSTTNQYGQPIPSTVSSGFFSLFRPASMCFLNQQVFIADGSSTVAVMSTNAITSTSTYQMAYLKASTTPSSAVPTYCSLAATWRGRLVLAMDQYNPQNFYMARVGKPQDWNYSATDPATAFAGNLSESGQIGEPLTAICPFSDDVMIMSTVNEIWMMEGDPAQGGSIVRMAGGGGILAPNAWCVDSSGAFYYLTSAGIWKVMPVWALYRPPELVSPTSWSRYFQSLDPAQTAITMIWDGPNKYIHIYATPTTSLATGTHLIYDTRNGGFWPEQFPQNQGPTCAVMYQPGVGANAQSIMMGGFDGNVYQYASGSPDDNGTPLLASATFAPIPAPGGDQGLLQQLQVDFGELSSTASTVFGSGFAATITVRGGPTAIDVSDLSYPSNDPAYQTWQTSVSTDRRAPIMYPRIAGGWFGITLSNSTDGAYFSAERVVLSVIPYGMNRTQR